MLEIKSFGSGSAGNCYLIDDSETKILIECGIKWAEIQKQLEFKTADIAGILLSHSHSDHCIGIKGAIKAAKTVYMSDGTADELAIVNHRIKRVAPRQAFRIGTFKVLPFEVEHDTEAPFGYLIESDNGAKLLFATDTYYIRYKFKGITHLMIETNYSESILDQQIAAGVTHKQMKRRLMKSHFSLENVKTFLKANDLSRLEEVWLIHLSDRNSNAEQFKKEIAEIVAVPVYIP